MRFKPIWISSGRSVNYEPVYHICGKADCEYCRIVGDITFENHADDRRRYLHRLAGG